MRPYHRGTLVGLRPDGSPYLARSRISSLVWHMKFAHLRNCRTDWLIRPIRVVLESTDASPAA